MKNSILLFSFIFSITLAFAQKGCPHKVKDSEGNSYKTVRIGQQCWMAENLRFVRLPDGTPIVCGSFEESDEPRGYFPNNDLNNVETYGYLLNWPAAMRACPKGWHLPSDAEWTQLTDYVSSQPQYGCDDTGGSNAKALSATTKWAECADKCTVGNDLSANNATGFGALPAGGFYGNSYGYFGKGTFFWSSTESGDGKAYKRYIDYNKTSMVRDEYYKYGGGAVRCVKD